MAAVCGPAGKQILPRALLGQQKDQLWELARQQSSPWFFPECDSVADLVHAHSASGFFLLMLSAIHRSSSERRKRQVPPSLNAGISPFWARRSEEHTSELQSLMRISYAVFCLKKQQHLPASTTQSS